MTWKGFRDVQATIEIDLTKPLEELWQALDKDARWGVNKAKKEGLNVSKYSGEEGWQEFYKIYKETCIKGGIKPFSYEGIKKNNSVLFICVRENKIIAGAEVIEDNERKALGLFLNSSLPEFLTLQPNNLLYWNIIEYGKINGFKIFDLGGFQLNAPKGTKLYEINRFKNRWGGQIKKYYIYSKNPFYILGRKIIRNCYLLKKLKDSLTLFFYK